MRAKALGALLLLVLVVGPAFGAASSPVEPKEIVDESGLTPALEFPTDAPRAHPALKDASGRVTVTVLTTDVRGLATALEGVAYTGLIGKNGGNELAAPTLTIPASAVEMIAALPGTVAVTPVEYPEKQTVRDPDALAAKDHRLTNYNSTINLGALGAWANGFRGQGTTVAIVDDGLDFSHPDLQGRAARVSDPASPYYPLPMAFDPFSMSTYLAPLPGTTTPAGDTKGTWYVNTSSTDRTVTHTIRVDGKNDFWTDGTELVSTDLRGEIVPVDFDLVTTYVTQDAGFWYIGFNSFANQTNMSFGVYINTTTSAPYTAGATTDPLGNFVNTVAGQRPEFAVYLRHYGLQDSPSTYDKNETIAKADVYAWSGASWGPATDITDPAIGGAFAYSGWSFLNDVGFIELAFPRAFLGDPSSFSVEVFTAGVNQSHAQDSAYSDLNVAFSPSPDWSSTPTTLSSAVSVGAGFWRHSYTRPDDTVSGQPNVALAWSTQYQVTGTSRSGTYYFGDLPDENFPLTRILVVDEAISGVYDTVYVDLDHNKDFTNDKPLKRYGKYQPVTEQWFDVSSPLCGGCPVRDEYSWADYVDPVLGVTSVDWSPNGAWLASGSLDHTVIVWDVATGAAVNRLNPHSGRILDVAFSPDGTKLAASTEDASGSGRHVAVVWNTADWSPVRTLAGHTAAVNSLSWSPDSTRLLTGSSDGTARIWTVATGTFLAPLTGHTGAVNGVHWGSANNLLTGSEDGTIRKWSQAGAFQGSLVYGAPITSVAYNANEAIIASGSRDGNVILWETATGNSLASGTSAHYNNEVRRVRWSAFNNDLASSSLAASQIDTTVVTWQVAAYNSFSTNVSIAAHVKDAKGYAALGIAWDPTGTLLASGGLEKGVKIWNGLSLDRSFSGHTDGITDSTYPIGGDGIADVSGGMLYFIGDGTNPIPYSDRYASRLGATNLVPAAGQLVALFGAYDAASSHGTLMASSIAGQGVTRYYDPGTMDAPSIPQVTGIAPETTLLAVGNIYVTTIYDAWFFTMEGYDGVPGTGDEPNVVANSFGFSSTYQDGWDLYSRFLDYVSRIHGGNAATFTVSSGNDGNGYGTVTSPGSAPNVVTVGASTDFFYRKHAGLEKGMSQSFGDVVPFSGRGPTAQGRPDPDILATGRMSVGSTPLNFRTGYNGAIASELWSGTSLASPLAAGVLALVYQAYASANGGVFPDAATAKSFLLSGADDVNNDVFTQGAGLVNADRATKLAARLDGTAVSPNVWVPGDYQGTKYEAFSNFLSPGETDSKTFTVTNRNATAGDTVRFSSGVYRRLTDLRYAFKTTVDGSGNAQPDWSFFYVTTPLATQLLSGPGIYRLGPLGPEKMAAIDPIDWLQADLLRIVFYTNTSALDPNLDGTAEYRYMVDVYDWTWNGITAPIPDTAGFGDLNRITINTPDANHMEARIRSPASRTHTGLAAGFRVFGTGIGGAYVQAAVQLYRRVPWNWVTLDKTTPTAIAAGAATTLTATLAVPAGTPVGTYEGGLYSEGNARPGSWTFTATGDEQYLGLPRINLDTATVQVNGVTKVAGTDYTLYARSGGLAFANLLLPGDLVSVNFTYREVSTVPVAVTVPAPAVEFSFGGVAPGQDDLFGYRMDMGFGNGGQGGDWRFLFVDVPNQGLFASDAGVRFLLDAEWQNERTDVNLFAFGAGGSVLGSLGVTFPSSIYGPVTLMANNGGSEETANFFTTTGGAREVVAPKLVGGLNVIALRQVRLNGTTDNETVSGSVGTITVNPDDVKVVTNQLAGSTSVQLWSSIDLYGIGAVAAGPSAPEFFVDLGIKQDNVDGDFIELLSRGSFTKQVNVLPSALILDIHITSDPATTSNFCNDLDLGVFLDGKGAGNAPNGQAEVSEFISYNADSDADEHVRLIKPLVEDDGDTAVNELTTGSPYLIKVLGFACNGPTGTFNMDLTLVQGSGFGVSGTSTLLIPAYQIRQVGLSWNLPGSTADGSMLGVLYVGWDIAPLMVLVPVELVLDRVPPLVTGLSIATRSGFRSDALHRTTLNDPQPTLVATASDPQARLDPHRFTATLDGDDVSRWVTPLYTAATATLTFVPPAPLSENGHVFTITVYDTAGNAATKTLPFDVDMTAPSLALDVPTTWYTASGAVTVSGTTDPTASVQIGGIDVPVSANGRFSRGMTLTAGRTAIEVTAMDWSDVDATGNPVAGNAQTRTLTVYVDATPPTITLRSGSTVGPVGTNTGLLLATVTDVIAAGLMSDPATLTVTVGGQRVIPRADGALETTVPLPAEGANGVTIQVTDLAGNVETLPVTFLRDTAAPEITLADVPARVDSGRLTLTGQVSGARTVTVNGRAVDASTGQFSMNVDLTPGTNQILVEAMDTAGNVATVLVGVDYQRPFAPTGFSFLTLVLAIVIALAIGVGLALLLFRRPPEPGETPVAPDPRLARLDDAYQSGQIDRATYEANRAKLEEKIRSEAVGNVVPADLPAPPSPPPVAPEDYGAEEKLDWKPVFGVKGETEEKPPAEPLAPDVEKDLQAPPPATDERLARLERAFLEGKITKESYEANVAKLGVSVPEAKPAKPQPAAPPPSPEEEKAAKLEKAFLEGKLSREAYEANLGKKAPAKPAPPPPAATTPPPPAEDKRAKLEQAYRDGKISKAAYDASVAKLDGVPPPPPEDPQVTRLNEAFQAGKISKQAYEENLRRLKGKA